jgi:hypothetical protein
MSAKAVVELRSEWGLSFAQFRQRPTSSSRVRLGRAARPAVPTDEPAGIVRGRISAEVP